MAGKKSKQRKGRPKKNTKSVSSDDDLICDICTEIFIDASDKLLQCERCDKWFCANCVDINDAAYQVMVERKDIHWYCTECETQAVSAVKTDKDIEDKCTAYMKSITERLDTMDVRIDNKADRDSVIALESRVKSLETKQTSVQSTNASANSGDDGSKADTVRETIEEQRERDFRAKNIIIHNLPESKKEEIEGRREDDIASVTNLFSALGITEEKVIEKCSRIGKKEDKVRITKVTVESVQLKRQILKKSRSLKDMENYKEIYVGPDLTKMQRKEQFLLRKELNERKEKGEKDIFIRRGKIVQARDRALQFKGGAAHQASK